ncbi:MAG: glycosyltransferase family 4 protein [Verrucomicrobiota bacterium]|nr:glycosyltransferase family 4 protein [Verrucomicrobiota bacterium]
MQLFADLLLTELLKRGIDVVLLRPEPLAGRLKPGASGVGKWLGYLDKGLAFPRQLRRATLAKDGKAVVHVCDHSNAFYTRHLAHVPHVVTCHDLLAVRSARGEFPENPTRWSGRLLQRLIVDGLNRAQAVACDSEATLADLLRSTAVPKEKAGVIFPSLNREFRPLPRSEAWRVIRERLGTVADQPFLYLFHVSGNHWYKHRSGVLRLFCEVRQKMPGRLRLIMAGSPLDPELERLREELNLGEDLLVAPDCTNSELEAFYSAAEALLFPSVAEGFGWPIIEAQACGCRVVTSDAAPMTELGGEAALYLELPSRGTRADPLWARAGAERVRLLLEEDERARETRIQLGFKNVARFSAANMIEGYMHLYERVISEAA